MLLVLLVSLLLVWLHQPIATSTVDVSVTIEKHKPLNEADLFFRCAGCIESYATQCCRNSVDKYCCKGMFLL